jgi:hypothetical protein
LYWPYPDGWQLYLWGFEGGKGIWPFIVYILANTLAYSLLAFVALVLAKHFFKRES